ncbi:transposable element Tc1 transposase [Elysia marginata]|uniref:Transposable element Tc1 transposase n=1 Tax=Elysia marginata TaxID=1093978 RepID=A0AAV4H571_9GAST|nr:transposable element Tc1 transposase [Elysia marginata]
MVWQGMAVAGKTPLVTVHGNFTAPPYIEEILRPQVVPALHSQGPNFMQDNAPSHRARMTILPSDFTKTSQFSIHDLSTHLICSHGAFMGLA